MLRARRNSPKPFATIAIRYTLNFGNRGSLGVAPPAATTVSAMVESCSTCPEMCPPSTSARRKGQGLLGETRGGGPRWLTAPSSTDADTEQSGVEGLKRLFALLVSPIDVGRQLDERLLVTLERRDHVRFVLFQKEMGVVANQPRLLKPCECAKV